MATHTAFPKYLTPKEVAEILRVRVVTLAVWRCTKRYPLPYTKVGNAVRYRADDVQKFLQKYEAAR